MTRGKLISIEGDVANLFKRHYALKLYNKIDAVLVGYPYCELNQFDCDGLIYTSARELTQQSIFKFLSEGKNCIVYSYYYDRISRLLSQGGNKEWILEGENKTIIPDIVYYMTNEKQTLIDKELQTLMNERTQCFKITKKSRRWIFNKINMYL
jgi:hypothetical protein